MIGQRVIIPQPEYPLQLQVTTRWSGEFDPDDYLFSPGNCRYRGPTGRYCQGGGIAKGAKEAGRDTQRLWPAYPEWSAQDRWPALDEDCWTTFDD